MTVEKLIQDCAQRGVTLEPRGGLLLISPEAATTPALVEQLRQHKLEIIAILENKCRESAWHTCKQVVGGDFDGAMEETINHVAAELQKLPPCQARDAALARLEREARP